MEEAVRGAGAPALPGLYRIRRVGLPGWDYIGQTGVGRMNLRRADGDAERCLRGVDAVPRPAHRRSRPLGAAAAEPRAARGLVLPGGRGDAVAEGTGGCRDRSAPPGPRPLATLNFDRMPACYRMSSGNNARLVAARRGFARATDLGQ